MFLHTETATERVKRRTEWQITFTLQNLHKSECWHTSIDVCLMIIIEFSVQAVTVQSTITVNITYVKSSVLLNHATDFRITNLRTLWELNEKKGYVSNIARTNVMLMFIRLNVFPFKLFNGVNLHGYKYILGGGKMKLKERSKPYLYPWKKNYHYYHHFGCHGENKNSKKLKKNRKTSLNDHARERAF